MRDSCALPTGGAPPPPPVFLTSLPPPDWDARLTSTFPDTLTKAANKTALTALGCYDCTKPHVPTQLALPMMCLDDSTGACGGGVWGGGVGTGGGKGDWRRRPARGSASRSRGGAAPPLCGVPSAWLLRGSAAAAPHLWHLRAASFIPPCPRHPDLVPLLPPPPTHHPPSHRGVRARVRAQRDVCGRVPPLRPAGRRG